MFPLSMNKTMTDIILMQQELIDKLIHFTRKILELLMQHIDVSMYESEFDGLLQGK